MLYQAAIFDMDGLLIDSERAVMQAWIDGAATVGVQLRPEAYAEVIGLADPESDAVLIGLLGGAEAFSTANRRVGEILAEKDSGIAFPLKTGAVEILRSLREMGIPCAVASSTACAEVRRRLNRVGVLHNFVAVAGGDEVERGKPDPAVYRLAASRLGVPTSACLAFEDSENGILSAVAAGAPVVLVPDLKFPPDAVARRAMQLLPSLHEAIPHLTSWFKGAGA